jgi:PAS domain S-box-containing protein
MSSSERARILLVDDEANVLLTIGTILADRGYEVETTESGRQAIDLVGAQPFDLVLTDLSLKDTDGLEVLAAVREKQADAVAIMLTGYASLDSAIEAIRRGAYDYLTKPTNVEELCHTIERGLEKRRLTLQLRRRVEELATLNRLANYGVGAVLKSAGDIGEALGRVVEIVDEIFAPAASAIFLEAGGALVSSARHAASVDPEAARGVAERAARTGEPAQVAGTLGVPIVWKGKTLGALIVHGVAGRRFTEEQVLTGTTIAGRVALAVANSDLYRAVSEEREKLRLILNAAGDGIIGLDAEARITFVSRAAERLLGVSEAEAKGLPIERFAASHPGAESIAAVRARAAGAPGGITYGEILFRPPSGEDVFCDALCCDIAVSAQGGRAAAGDLAAVISIRDARERRSIEEQKTSVISHLTHELKTPLTSILAYDYLMMTGRLGPLDPRQAEALRVIHRNGQQLLELIQNMLVTAQISQGKARVQLGPLRLEALFTAAREMFEPVAAEHQITLTFEGGGGIDVVADAEMLPMVLNNLVANALRFTDPGGRVRVAAEARGESEVVVEVRDTGVGIHEEFHERIFQRYFQVSGGRGGTGLGLEIAKTIVEAHGGRIWVESRPGEGARFLFTLQRAAAPVQERAAAQ